MSRSKREGITIIPAGFEPGNNLQNTMDKGLESLLSDKESRRMVAGGLSEAIRVVANAFAHKIKTLAEGQREATNSLVSQMPTIVEGARIKQSELRDGLDYLRDQAKTGLEGARQINRDMLLARGDLMKNTPREITTETVKVRSGKKGEVESISTRKEKPVLPRTMETGGIEYTFPSLEMHGQGVTAFSGDTKLTLSQENGKSQAVIESKGDSAGIVVIPEKITVRGGVLKVGPLKDKY